MKLYTYLSLHDEEKLIKDLGKLGLKQELHINNSCYKRDNWFIMSSSGRYTQITTKKLIKLKGLELIKC